MRSPCVFLDCVVQGRLAGRRSLINREPLPIDGDGISIGSGIAHGHRTHMNFETKQYPSGISGRGSLSQPGDEANWNNSGAEDFGDQGFPQYLNFVLPSSSHARGREGHWRALSGIVKLGGSDKVPRSVAGSSGSKNVSACVSSCLHQGGQGGRITTRPRQLDNANPCGQHPRIRADGACEISLARPTDGVAQHLGARQVNFERPAVARLN